ncbi:MAG TPA: DNA repair protein RecN [Candidatus Sumerlaeota bacterium]|nr:DNA repair protein RecN [Candidatus Sumerlaeota bacterium]
MLRSLHIENLATIEALTIEFGEGLNALTGETGAGKSIVVGGLGLALGDRAAAEAIRAGARVAVVEACFALPSPPAGLTRLLTDELELEWTPAEPLTLRRELSAAGRNRCFVGGQMVNVADLRRIGELLVDFHGQHEHQSLLHASAARDALDAHAGHAEVVEAYRRAWREVVELRRRRDELDQAAREFEQRLDYLEFQLGEFDKVNPRAGELLELEHEEHRLARADELTRSAAEAYALLYEGSDDQPSVLGQLREVERRMGALAEVEPPFAERLAALAEQKAALEDLAYALRDYADQVEADPARLDEVIARSEAIRRLTRKHGGTEESLFAAVEGMRRERERMERDDAERREIGARVAEAERRLRAAGEKLRAGRKAAAERFAREVGALLKRLHMDKARFEVLLEELEAPGGDGMDRVELLLAANPGLPPAPLRKIASGGELSRVMLAIKTALARRDAIATLVFDEIDAGISGETAVRVGAVMEKLGESHQVLCITHHAAIAARAARHLAVSKSARRRETFTEVTELTGSARLDELARLMGGDAATEAGRELARQLMG